MAATLGSSNKFVLIIGDEGALLLRMDGPKVRDQCFAASPEPADSDPMARLLARFPTTPIHPLVDVLDQQFAKDTIPPVSFFDSARLVQRRLGTAFPGVTVRRASYLGRVADGGRQDKRYLLAGLPSSPALDAWFDWLRGRHNPVKPLALLPLEAVSVAHDLSISCHPDGASPEWVMLVTRQLTGGFRHVVVRQGEFVFTRLTPSLPADAPIIDIAAAIASEYRLSMGYLRRMAFDDRQGMDVIVVGAPALRPFLVEADIPADQLTVLSPDDAGHRLNLGDLGVSAGDRGDTLHGAAFARARRPRLSLLPQALYEKRAGHFVSVAAYAMIALVIAWLSFDLSDAFVESWDIEQAYNEVSQQAVQREAQLDSMLDEAGEPQVSGPEIADTIALYDRLSAAKPSPLALLALVAPALGPDIVIRRIDWETPDRSDTRDARLSLNIHIASTDGDNAAAIGIVDAFSGRLAHRLAGLDVRVEALPLETSSEQTSASEAGSMAEDGDVSSGHDAVVSIYVPVDWPRGPSS